MISNTVLDKIVAQKRVRLNESKKQKPLSVLIEHTQNQNRTPIPFAQALQSHDSIAIIAEVKKASPSKGLIRDPFLPLEIAQAYLKSDVQAMSVLTEQDFFQGDEQYFMDIREISPIPMLRKDFMFDEYQVYEAKLMGADAILLIAAMLDNDEINALQNLAHDLSLQTLIEIHNEDELKRVLQLSNSPNMLGVNNRNLHDFSEDIHTTERLIHAMPIPNEICLVSESAIRKSDDLVYIDSLGVDAVLIGECFMREDDVAGAVAHMRSGLSS